LFAATLVAATTAWGQPSTTPPPDPTGEWLVAKAVARIRIVNCTGNLWGVVSWETTPGIDSKNPDQHLRTRPTLGMPILLGMAQTKPNRWDGKIYNSQDGNTYSANISLANPDTLRVQGCFLGFLCGGENWTRVQPNDPPPQTGNVRPPNSRPASSRSASPPPPATTGVATESADDVCLRVGAAPRLSH
jgi:uncharacterized protein (DUF2147 family)